MKKIKCINIIAILLAILSMSMCSRVIYPDYIDSEGDGLPAKGKITLNGSTSMTKLCNALSEALTELYPDIHVEKSDTGSGAAVDSVLSGNALIGDLSRHLKEEEKDERLNVVITAYDGIAIIVNRGNPVDGLSYQEIQDIFTKKISNWSEVGGKNQRITLIGREESSGTRDGFESALNIVAKTKYDVQYQENGDIISKVGNDDGAVGYCSLFSVSDNLKALTVDNIAPNSESVLSGEYKISRPFIEIYNKNHKTQLIDLWFDFIFSDVGRNIIIQQGLVPTK